LYQQRAGCQRPAAQPHGVDIGGIAQDQSRAFGGVDFDIVKTDASRFRASESFLGGYADIVERDEGKRIVPPPVGTDIKGLLNGGTAMAPPSPWAQ
jgi:hypothetical protein